MIEEPARLDLPKSWYDVCIKGDPRVEKTIVATSPEAAAKLFAHQRYVEVRQGFVRVIVSDHEEGEALAEYDVHTVVEQIIKFDARETE